MYPRLLSQDEFGMSIGFRSQDFQHEKASPGTAEVCLHFGAMIAK
jgi:hypothetical protein